MCKTEEELHVIQFCPASQNECDGATRYIPGNVSNTCTTRREATALINTYGNYREDDNHKNNTLSPIRYIPTFQNTYVENRTK
jgi:hypothetical protein